MDQEGYKALIRHQTYLERFGSGLANRILELFDNEQLKYYVTSKKKFTKKIESLLKKDKKEAKKQMASELRQMAKLELSFLEQLSKDFFDFGLTNKQIDELINTVLGKPLIVNNVTVEELFDSSFARKEQISKNLNNLVAGELKTTSEALIELNAMLSQFARNMKQVNQSLAFNVGHEIREQAYNKSEAVERVVISAVLDGRTTPYCMNIDGTIFNKGEGPRPQFHVGCRTTAIPLLVGETDEDVIDMLSLRATIGPGEKYKKGDDNRLRAHKAQVNKGLVKIGAGGEGNKAATNYADFLASNINTSQGKLFIQDRLGIRKGNRFIKLIEQGKNPDKALNEILFETEAKDLDLDGLKKRVKQ